MKRIIDAFILIFKVKNFHMIFLDYLGLLRLKEYKLIFRNGLIVYIRANTNDKSRIKEIFVKKEYIQEIDEIKKEGIIVFDVGANIGFFSLMVAKLNPTTVIYAFEPETSNFKILMKSIEINKLDNIKVYKVALNSHTGIMKLNISPNTGGHTLINTEDFTKRNRISDKSEIVDLLSFEDFIEQHQITKIDFLKMDIEGGEYEIFYNMSKETFNKINIISMEYHFVDELRNGEKLQRLFEANGFTVLTKYPLIYATH